MLTYKTFRWKVHQNTAKEIDNVSNTLPTATMVEGYIYADGEIFVTVSHYEHYQKEIARELAKRV